ncbi:MAG: intradiol ring-cleavage dioxygenase [Xanthobacteraceae bacterium]|nr:intradiol ring-cleavage dioxygenase [Xanthobacteraceae bacterium]
MVETTFTRRHALATLAGSSAAMAAPASAAPAQAAPVADVPRMCVLTPQQIEGPYYFDPGLVRSDIREDREGIALRLSLQVADAGSCKPIVGARVDVWHADALGWYSGYKGQSDGHDVSTVGRTFLRGIQTTDDAGLVGFDTIYPGWYQGRTAHIHFKVFLDRTSVLVGQLYFPDALSEYIYTKIPPYSSRAERDTINKTDMVLMMGRDDPHQSFCRIKEEADCYLASLVLGVDRAGRPIEGPPGPPPGMAGGPPPKFAGGPPPGFAGPRRPQDAAALVPPLVTPSRR